MVASHGELLRAADDGERCGEDANALFALGVRYATGRDVEPDLTAAHKWFNLAAMLGHGDARVYRHEVAAEMAPADIAKAQRAAREWLTDYQARPARVSSWQAAAAAGGPFDHRATHRPALTV